jgi:hypothetical protein
MVGWTVGFGNFGKWWNKSVTSLRVVKLGQRKRSEKNGEKGRTDVSDKYKFSSTDVEH